MSGNQQPSKGSSCEEGSKAGTTLYTAGDRARSSPTAIIEGKLANGSVSGSSREGHAGRVIAVKAATSSPDVEQGSQDCKLEPSSQEKAAVNGITPKDSTSSPAATAKGTEEATPSAKQQGAVKEDVNGKDAASKANGASGSKNALKNAGSMANRDRKSRAERKGSKTDGKDSRAAGDRKRKLDEKDSKSKPDSTRKSKSRAEGKESIAEAVGDAKASGKTEAAAHASKAAGDDKVRSKGDDKDIGSKANGDSKQKREGKAERSSKERRPRSDGKRASKEGSRSRSKGCETSKGREASKDRRASKSPGRKRRASRSPSPRRYTRSPPRGVDRRVRPFPGGLRAGSPPPRGIDRRLGPRGFGLGPPLRGWDAPPGLRPLPFDGPGGYRGYPPDEPWGRRPPLGYGRDRSPPPRGAFDPDYDDPRGRPPPGARFADGLGGGGRYPGAFRDGRPGSPPPAGYERWRRWGPYELPPGERSPPQSADFARSRGLESSGDMRRSPGGGREPSRERDKAGVEVSVHTAPESERRRAGETSSVRDSEKVWSAQSGWDKPPVVREVDQKVSRFADNSRGSVSHPDEHASAGTTTDARDRQQADVQEARSESFSHQSQNRGSLRQEERSTHRSPADVRSPQSGSHTGRSNGVRGSPASRTRGREGLHTEGEVQQSISVHLDRSIDPEEKCWYYIDPQGNTQGACSIVQFHTWIAMMRKDASLKVEYEKFKAVTVWREGMAVRVPLMTLLSSQQSPSPPTTPRADELPSPNRLVA